LSDHPPVDLQIGISPNPNEKIQVWLEDKDFRKMASSQWEKVNPQNLNPIMVQFVTSLKKMKTIIKKWIPFWEARRSSSILDTEEHIKYLYQNLNNGPLTETKLEELKNLENWRHIWLKTEEQEWHQKIRATWIKEGDNNTKFFHNFTNFMKNLNSIWSSFTEKVKAGENYFKNLFFDPTGCPI